MAMDEYVERHVADATDHITWAAFPRANQDRIRDDVEDIVEMACQGGEYGPTVTEYLEGDVDEDVLRTSAWKMARSVVTGSRAVVDLAVMAGDYEYHGHEAGTGKVSYDTDKSENGRMARRADDIETVLANVAEHYESGLKAARYREDAVREELGEAPMDAVERTVRDPAELDERYPTARDEDDDRTLVEWAQDLAADADA